SQTDSSMATVAVVLVDFGWYVAVGAAGLFLLRFLLRESLRRAKLGPLAPPPEPLFRALHADTFGAAGTGLRTAGDALTTHFRNLGVYGNTATLAATRRPTTHCARCGHSYAPNALACPRCGATLILLD